MTVPLFKLCVACSVRVARSRSLPKGLSGSRTCARAMRVPTLR
jgi:hypothetical protein